MRNHSTMRLFETDQSMEDNTSEFKKVIFSKYSFFSGLLFLTGHRQT